MWLQFFGNTSAGICNAAASPSLVLAECYCYSPAGQIVFYSILHQVKKGALQQTVVASGFSMAVYCNRDVLLCSQ